MGRLVQLVIAALLALASVSAHAGYALARPPTGWVKSSVGATYQAPAGFAANNGVFHTTATINVAGRLVEVPAGLRVAANAAAFVSPVLRLTPGGLLGAAALAWMGTYGIQWLNDQWMAEDQNGPPVPGRFWGSSASTGACKGTPSCSYGDALDAYVQSRCVLDARHTQCQIVGAPVLNSGDPGSPGETLFYKVSVKSFFTQDGTWYEPGPVLGAIVAGPVSEGAPVGGVLPATEVDFERLTGTIPDAALSDIARVVPVPLELPEIQPQRVPTGSPVPKPGTNPQKYGQPVVDIVPKPSAAEPWRVELNPGEVESEDPQGQPDAEPLENKPEAQKTVGKDLPQLCDLYPDVLACQKMGKLEAQTIPAQSVPLSINAESGFGEGGGQCPADKTFTVMGKSMAFKWTLICDFASGIRPVVIGMAWLAAAMGFLGIARKE